MLDAQLGAELIELVLACCGAFAQAEEPVGEFLAVVREYGPDADRAGALQVAQEPSGIGCGPGLEDADAPGAPPVQG